jgi:hypothetical protein
LDHVNIAGKSARNSITTGLCVDYAETPKQEGK